MLNFSGEEMIVPMDTKRRSDSVFFMLAYGTYHNYYSCLNVNLHNAIMQGCKTYDGYLIHIRENS
jgi:hypothetical protein